MLDDLMVTRREHDLLLVVNAGNKVADIQHLITHTFVHEQPRTGGAHLPGIAEDAHRRAGDGGRVRAANRNFVGNPL